MHQNRYGTSNLELLWTFLKQSSLPISFTRLFNRWQMSGRIIMVGICSATSSHAFRVFPVLSDVIPEKFRYPIHFMTYTAGVSPRSQLRLFLTFNSTSLICLAICETSDVESPSTK